MACWCASSEHIAREDLFYLNRLVTGGTSSKLARLWFKRTGQLLCLPWGPPVWHWIDLAVVPPYFPESCVAFRNWDLGGFDLCPFWPCFERGRLCRGGKSRVRCVWNARKRIQLEMCRKVRENKLFILCLNAGGVFDVISWAWQTYDINTSCQPIRVILLLVFER